MCSQMFCVNADVYIETGLYFKREEETEKVEWEKRRKAQTWYTQKWSQN